MSLINEALQRAESEKRRSQGAAAGADDDDNLSVWPAPEDDIPYIFGRHQKGLRGAIVLGAIVIATVGVVMYFSLPPAHNGFSPARAGGASATAPCGSQPASGPKAPAPAETEAEPEVALTPPEPAPKAPPPAPPAVSVKPPPAPQPVVATAPATAPAAAEDTTLRPAQFKLGAILQSNGTGYALINNQMVTEGDDIDGARVVVIRKFHVVIERDGQRLVLRM